MSQLLVNVLAEDKLSEDLRTVDRRPVDLADLADAPRPSAGRRAARRLALCCPRRRRSGERFDVCPDPAVVSRGQRYLGMYLN
jgi:hypothetical protein